MEPFETDLAPQARNLPRCTCMKPLGVTPLISQLTLLRESLCANVRLQYIPELVHEVHRQNIM